MKDWEDRSRGGKVLLVLLVLAILSTLLGTCVWLGSAPAPPLTRNDVEIHVGTVDIDLVAN